MDAWSEDQLRKMQLGGNDALNSFLAKYGVDKDTEIPEKYNSQAAEARARPAGCCEEVQGADSGSPACRKGPLTLPVAQIYREKIKAEAQGLPYAVPPPSKVAPAPRASASAGSRASASSSSRQGGWDDWGEGSAGAREPAIKVCAQALVRWRHLQAMRPGPRHVYLLAALVHVFCSRVSKLPAVLNLFVVLPIRPGAVVLHSSFWQDSSKEVWHTYSAVVQRGVSSFRRLTCRNPEYRGCS